MINNLAGFARHTVRLGMVLMLTLLLAFGALAQAPRATAAPMTQSVAITTTVAHPLAASSPLTTSVPVLTAWSDCRRIAAGYPNPWLKVAKALAYWKCAPTVIGAVGRVSADHICWGSQQWWGGPYRWVVWMITTGQYNKC